jgi:hypothetical protein
MAYKTKVYDASVHGFYRTVEAGAGTVLYVGSKTYQVMSDIWETGSYAVVWNAAEGRVQTIDWIEDGKVDASPETFSLALQWRRQQVYTRQYNKLLSEAEQEAEQLVRGCKAKVVRGRKFPIGTEGKVVGFSDSQWGRNVGIATSDVMHDVVGKNGKTYSNHKDVIWVAMKNVERADIGQIDIAAIDRAANAAAESSCAKGWAVP